MSIITDPSEIINAIRDGEPSDPQHFIDIVETAVDSQTRAATAETAATNSATSASQAENAASTAATEAVNSNLSTFQQQVTSAETAAINSATSALAAQAAAEQAADVGGTVIKIDEIPQAAVSLYQTTGTSTTGIMSQDATTRELALKANNNEVVKTFGANTIQTFIGIPLNLITSNIIKLTLKNEVEPSNNKIQFSRSNDFVLANLGITVGTGNTRYFDLNTFDLAGSDVFSSTTPFRFNQKPVSLIDSQSLDGYGYIKYSNGLIIQWGTASVLTTGTAITFPITFTNLNYKVLATPIYDNTVVRSAIKTSASQFYLASTINTSADWYAIGV